MMMTRPIDKEESVTALTLIPRHAGSGLLAARETILGIASGVQFQPRNVHNFCPTATVVGGSVKW